MLAGSVGFAGGYTGQYLSDIATNISNGETGRKIFSPISTKSEYLRSGIGGTAVGVSALFGGPVGAGTAATLTNIVNDKIDGNQINYGEAAMSGVITAATAGVLSGYKIPGRMPNLLTKSFFTGSHTKNELMKEATGLSIQYTLSVISGIVKGLKDNKKTNDKI